MMLVLPLYCITFIKVYYAYRWMKGGQTRTLFQSYFTISISYYATWIFMFFVLFLISYKWGSWELISLEIVSICTSIISMIALFFHMKFKDR